MCTSTTVFCIMLLQYYVKIHLKTILFCYYIVLKCTLQFNINNKKAMRSLLKKLTGQSFL